MINHIEGTQRPVPKDSETASDLYAKMPENAVKSMLCGIWRVRKQSVSAGYELGTPGTDRGRRVQNGDAGYRLGTAIGYGLGTANTTFTPCRN